MYNILQVKMRLCWGWGYFEVRKPARLNVENITQLLTVEHSYSIFRRLQILRLSWNSKAMAEEYCEVGVWGVGGWVGEIVEECVGQIAW